VLRVNVENRSMNQKDIGRLVQVVRRTADRILAEKSNHFNHRQSGGRP